MFDISNRITCLSALRSGLDNQFFFGYSCSLLIETSKSFGDHGWTAFHQGRTRGGLAARNSPHWAACSCLSEIPIASVSSTSGRAPTSTRSSWSSPIRRRHGVDAEIWRGPRRAHVFRIAGRRIHHAGDRHLWRVRRRHGDQDQPPHAAAPGRQRSAQIRILDDQRAEADADSGHLGLKRQIPWTRSGSSSPTIEPLGTTNGVNRMFSPRTSAPGRSPIRPSLSPRAT